MAHATRRGVLTPVTLEQQVGDVLCEVRTAVARIALVRRAIDELVGAYGAVAAPHAHAAEPAAVPVPMLTPARFS